MTDQIYILAQSTSKSLFQTYVLDGGPTMIPVAIVLLALIALTVYNFIMVAKGKFLNNAHQEVVVDSITNVRIRTAILESEEETTFFGRMLKFSLPFIDATDPKLGREKFEESVEEFIYNENQKIMVGINYLSLVAQIAPMVGLFGTVLGMVGAFAQLSEGDPDPSALAGQISVALLTTLWGLVIAIPAVIIFFIVKNMLQGQITKCQVSAYEAFDAMEETVFGEGRQAKIPEGLS